MGQAQGLPTWNSTGPLPFAVAQKVEAMQQMHGLGVEVENEDAMQEKSIWDVPDTPAKTLN
jgi:hypothetical protein